METQTDNGMSNTVVPLPLDKVAAELAGALRPGGRTKPVKKPDAAPTWLSFAGQLEQLVASNAELRDAVEATMAKSARLALIGGDSAVPSTEDFREFLRQSPAVSKGGSVVRAFWWGFHVQVSHEDLQAFVESLQQIDDILQTVASNVPPKVQPWIRLAAIFISQGLALLQSLDRGRGVYISMSWFAPAVFVPTPV